jgi:hypothetical protein
MYHLNGYRWPFLGRLHALAARREDADVSDGPPAPAAAATGS